MSWPLTLHLARWAAWAPGLDTPAAWQSWPDTPIAPDAPDAPAVSFVPAMQRRRLSRLSRLCLQVAHDAAPEQTGLPTVFASRHGELHRTVGLLDQLAMGEPLSPMAFSLSVHNTASGLYSIQTGNTAPSTAVAAGQDTLPMALLEAAGLLLTHPAVLVVYAEEPLPDCYHSLPHPADELGSLALLLQSAPTGCGLSLAPQSAALDAAYSTPLLPWLAWLHTPDTATPRFTAGERHTWCWHKTGDGWRNPR